MQWLRQADERHFYSKSRNCEEKRGYRLQTSLRPCLENSIRFQGPSPRIILCSSMLCLPGQLAKGPQPSGDGSRAWLPWRWDWKEGSMYWKEKTENIWKITNSFLCVSEDETWGGSLGLALFSHICSCKLSGIPKVALEARTKGGRRKSFSW